MLRRAFHDTCVAIAKCMREVFADRRHEWDAMGRTSETPLPVRREGHECDARETDGLSCSLVSKRDGFPKSNSSWFGLQMWRGAGGPQWNAS
jgi:hypothetical protein